MNRYVILASIAFALSGCATKPTPAPRLTESEWKAAHQDFLDQLEQSCETKYAKEYDWENRFSGSYLLFHPVETSKKIDPNTALAAHSQAELEDQCKTKRAGSNWTRGKKVAIYDPGRKLCDPIPSRDYGFVCDATSSKENKGYRWALDSYDKNGVNTFDEFLKAIEGRYKPETKWTRTKRSTSTLYGVGTNYERIYTYLLSDRMTTLEVTHYDDHYRNCYVAGHNVKCQNLRKKRIRARIKGYSRTNIPTLTEIRGASKPDEYAALWYPIALEAEQKERAAVAEMVNSSDRARAKKLRAERQAERQRYERDRQEASRRADARAAAKAQIFNAPSTAMGQADQNLRNFQAQINAINNQVIAQQQRRERQARQAEMQRREQARQASSSRAPARSTGGTGSRQATPRQQPANRQPIVAGAVSQPQGQSDTGNESVQTATNTTGENKKSSTPGRAVPACLSLRKDGDKVHFDNTCSHWISVAYCSEDAGISGRMCGDGENFYTDMMQLAPGENHYKYKPGRLRTAVCEGWINNWDSKALKKYFASDSAGHYRCLSLPTFTPSRN